MSLQYIIDGYNLTNHPYLAAQNKKHFDCREFLISYISSRRLCGSLRNKATVVFDGYPPQELNLEADNNYSIIFSRKISADEKIKMLVEQVSNRKSLIVVSDDKEIKIIAKNLGAGVMGAADFLEDKNKRIHAKKKHEESYKPELTYSQMHKINEELRKLWLKEP